MSAPGFAKKLLDAVCTVTKTWATVFCAYFNPDVLDKSEEWA